MQVTFRIVHFVIGCLKGQLKDVCNIKCFACYTVVGELHVTT